MADEVKPTLVPLGYGKLPTGVRCRCIKLWTDGVDHYCCKGAPPMTLPSARIDELRWRPVSEPPVAISVISRFYDDEMGDYVYQVIDPGMHIAPGSEWLPLSGLDDITALIAEVKAARAGLARPIEGVDPKLVQYVAMLRHECAFRGPCSDYIDGCSCSAEELGERDRARRSPPVKAQAETASPRPDEGKAEPVAWPADDTALAQMCEDFQTGSVAFANEPEEFHHLIEFTPPMLREFVARHPPYASPLPVEAGEPVGLPQDVIDLVIEARNVAYSDQSPEAIRALDKSVEAFAERVGWEDDPTPLEAEDRP